MKRLILFVALVAGFGVSARSQVVGIFEQGAEELGEYGRQIAALAMLLNRQEKGYQVIETGLSLIGSITGDELSLHKNYYASLGVVNRGITQSPELKAFLSTESQILNGLTAALASWRQSPYLTSTDHSYVTRMSSVIVDKANLQLYIFNALTSNDSLTMSDDIRVEMLFEVYAHIRDLCVYTRNFIDAVEILILNRMQ
jgi:hypothetical protein